MMKFAMLITQVAILILLSGCAEFMRVWVPPPEATAATPGRGGRDVTYWHTLDRTPACKIEDEYSERVEKFSWNGECKNGLAEGCGTLVGPISKMTGCFIAGKKSGRFVDETTDHVTVFVYTPTGRNQISFVEKPGQAERVRIRQEAYAAQMAEKHQRDAEELSQAMQSVGAVLSASQASAQPTQVQRPVTPPPSNSPPSAVQRTQQQIPASDSQPDMKCIEVTRPNGANWALMKNLCGYYITVDWCYTGAGGDCKKATWGGGNLGNIAPYGNREASTFISGAGQHELYLSVCSGRDKIIQAIGPNAFSCK